MPYKVEKRGDQYCVVKEGGETVKCHESREKALAHMRALWANVRDSAIQEFSMSIVKATSKNGEMAWRSVNSDIEEDVFGERMSIELFNEFNRHIQNNDSIPEPFKSAICEEAWCGGMPYLSIAHYKTGKDRVNVPGEPNKIYVDGKALKSTGTLYDTPLGKSVFKSLKKDLTEKSDNPVRVSIGFLDLEHTHGDRFTFTRKSLDDRCPLCKEGIGDKIYKKGHLVHLALTRVPANPRTEMLLEKSMTTKLEDAKSIIEDEEVLETLDLKSQAEDVLVIKNEEVVEKEHDCDPGDEECMKKYKKGKYAEKSVAETTVVSTTATNVAQPHSSTITIPAPVTSTTTITPTPEYSPAEKSFAALREKILSLKSQGATGESALQELQKNFDELGEVIKSEFTPKPTPEELARKDLEITLRSALSEMLPQALAQVVAPLQSEIAELRALSQKAPIKKEETPKPRGLSASLVQKQAIERAIGKSVDQFQKIAEASVGLPN